MKPLCSLFMVFATVLTIEAQTAVPSNVVIPPGYKMTAVATGLNFPTALTFQGDSIFVAEAGIITPPAVKQVDQKGNITTVLTSSMLPTGVLVSPVTGITSAQGWIWLVHRQMVGGRAGWRYLQIHAARSGRHLSNCVDRFAVFR